MMSSSTRLADRTGRSSLQLAREPGYADMVRMLKQATQPK